MENFLFVKTSDREKATTLIDEQRADSIYSHEICSDECKRRGTVTMFVKTIVGCLTHTCRTAFVIELSEIASGLTKGIIGYHTLIDITFYCIQQYIAHNSIIVFYHTNKIFPGYSLFPEDISSAGCSVINK